VSAAENLESIVGAWTEARRGRAEPLAALLREDVVWQGVLPDQICRNRAEVLERMARPRGPRLTRFEAEAIGNRVVVSVEGAEFPPLEGQPDRRQRSLVFTFADDLIVRIDSAPSRERAFEIARGAV
jgi:hypothetical protein